jgi:CheY-like chemotaxis protein
MILLVEDEADDVFLMERAMRKAKLCFSMHNAKNGQEAVDYLQGAGKYSQRATYPLPSLIFLDLKIPFIHGFEVLRWIRQQPSLNGIPVIMLTSSLEASDQEKAVKLGAEGFLIKPPAPEKLVQVFQDLPLIIKDRLRSNSLV